MTIKNRQILSPSPLLPLSPSIAIHNLYEQQLIPLKLYKISGHLLRKLRFFAAGDRLVIHFLNLKAGKSGAIPALCRNCESQNADFGARFARLLVDSLRRTGKEIIC